VVHLYDKGVSIPSNTTMFDFILLSTPATCFGLLSGHHQAGVESKMKSNIVVLDGILTPLSYSNTSTTIWNR
jgi:hypothetical protein